ncbi:MAG: septum formation initiator family protein [Chloroflexota bacterium]
MAKVTSRREKRQRAKRLGILTDAQVALGWFVITALVALLGAVYLNQASRIASTGRRIQLLQNELDELKRENSELEQAIAEAQSLERLQEEALRLGFVRADPGDIEYLVVNEYPAEATPQPPPAPRPEPNQVSTFSEAVRLALQDRLGEMVRGQAGETEATVGNETR